MDKTSSRPDDKRCCFHFRPFLVVLAKRTTDLDPASVLRVRRDRVRARKKRPPPPPRNIRGRYFITIVIIVVVVKLCCTLWPSDNGRPTTAVPFVSYRISPDFPSAGRSRARRGARPSAVRVRPTRSPYAFCWLDQRRRRCARAGLVKTRVSNDANRPMRADRTFTFSNATPRRTAAQGKRASPPSFRCFFRTPPPRVPAYSFRTIVASHRRNSPVLVS